MKDSALDKNRRIALLVDAENIDAGNWPTIHRIFAGLADTVTLTCFADFTDPAHAGWLDVCRRNGGTAEMVLRTGDKNSADIALTVAAMELLNADAAEMFVIVAHENDFAPLAHRITSAGCIAVGMGYDTASQGLRRAFDRYIVLPDKGRSARPEPAFALAPDQIAKLSVLLKRLSRHDPTGAVLLSRLGLALKKDYPDLAAMLTRGRLRTALRQYDLADEYGQGIAIRVTPRCAEWSRKIA